MSENQDQRSDSMGWLLIILALGLFIGLILYAVPPQDFIDFFTQKKIAETDAEFFYNCEGEPYVGCGMQVGWVNGRELTQFIDEVGFELGFYLDINCFRDEGSSLYQAMSIELRHDSEVVHRAKAPTARDLIIDEEGTYTAMCIFEDGRVADTDKFTVTLPE